MGENAGNGAAASEAGVAGGVPRPTQEEVAALLRAHKGDSNLPPGPRMPAGLQMMGVWTRPTSFFEQCRARYGNPFTLRIRKPATPFVVVSNPDEIKELFLAPADVLYVGEGSSSIEKYTGHTGLACMDEDEHLTRRRVMSPAMHGEAVRRMTADIGAIAERDVESWPRDKTVELYPRVHRLTLKVVFRMVFGPRQDPRLDQLLDLVMSMMQFNDKPASIVPIHALSPRAVGAISAFRPSGLHRFLKLRERTDRLIIEVVKERRAEGVDGDDLSLLNLLLAAQREDGSELTAVEVRDEIMTNFVAGTTTTAASITWAVEHLSHEREVLERLTSELSAGDGAAYLDATVQEILRRRPPLPHIIPRLVMKPIEIGGRSYAPGVHLWGSAYLLHHDPLIYPEPYAFRPERFLEATPGTYTWIPFGGGRRRCLGKEIADVEIKCVLRAVIGRYEMTGAAPNAGASRAKIVTVAPASEGRVALLHR